MDLKKLKLDKFNHIKIANFPENIPVEIVTQDENAEVVALVFLA